MASSFHILLPIACSNSAFFVAVSSGQSQFGFRGSNKVNDSDPDTVISIEYRDSQRSFSPSPSESLTLGLVPISASSMFVRPSLSGSPLGPLSGSGKVSF